MTKVRFLNDVCLRQMMWASPNDDADANDVCLRAHKGKHRIIASETNNIILSVAKNIISPQAIHHLTNSRFYGTIVAIGGVVMHSGLAGGNQCAAAIHAAHTELIDIVNKHDTIVNNRTH